MILGLMIVQVVSANLLFALLTAYLRVCRGAAITFIVAGVMCASASNFIIALMSYAVRLGAMTCQPTMCANKPKCTALLYPRHASNHHFCGSLSC